jgi:hypothetical protein
MHATADANSMSKTNSSMLGLVRALANHQSEGVADSDGSSSQVGKGAHIYKILMVWSNGRHEPM